MQYETGTQGEGQIRLCMMEPLSLAIKIMLGVFTAFLLLWVVGDMQDFLLGYLAITPDKFFRHGWLWQAVTSIFLHAGVGHFLWNMIFFLVFAPALCNWWGQREFLKFFFLCGISVSVISGVVDVIRGDLFTPSLGASGVIFGLMVAYGMTFSNRMIFAFFVLPMRVPYFVAIMMGIELLLCIQGAMDGVAHVAHVSGGVFGWLYIKYVRRKLRMAGQPSVKAKVAKTGSKFSTLEVYDDSRD